MTIDLSTRDLLAATTLESLYPVLAANRMTAGWHKKRPSLWTEPRTTCQAQHWRYEVGALALAQAGRWMDTELAERRNVVLFNPVEANDYDTVGTLVAAYQMVRPGEYARAHRHSPNALRLVVDAGPGCYTVVDGARLPMRTGDLLLTPGNSWHSHCNEGEADAYWIDVLDVPLVHRLGPMFFEPLPGGTQPVTATPAAHPYYFPRSTVLAHLEGVAADGGIKRFRADTADSIRTMAITYHQFAAGAREHLAGSTASRVLAVMDGSGKAAVGGQLFAWSRVT